MRDRKPLHYHASNTLDEANTHGTFTAASHCHHLQVCHGTIHKKGNLSAARWASIQTTPTSDASRRHLHPPRLFDVRCPHTGDGVTLILSSCSRLSALAGSPLVAAFWRYSLCVRPGPQPGPLLSRVWPSSRCGSYCGVPTSILS